MSKPVILVVEDEAVVALDLQKRLSDMGYEVPAVAMTGPEAVVLTETFSPELILMDIRLASNTSGIEAAHQIRCHHDVPVVYVTAYADEATIQQAKLTRPYGYLVKPFSDSELRAAIEIALYKHRSEVAGRAYSEESLTPAHGVTSHDLRIETPVLPETPGQQEFMRLPRRSEKSPQEAAGTTWHITLVPVHSPQTSIRLEVFDDIIIGRASLGAEPDLDLTSYGAEELGVSRQHALLRPTRETLYLYDMASTNGTFCNDQRAWLGKPLVISEGDEIRFGSFRVRVTIDSHP